LALLLFALIFLFSTITVGTMAWSDTFQHKTNVMTGKYLKEEEPGSIAIMKDAVNSDKNELTQAQQDETFTFIVVFSAGENYVYSVDGADEKTLGADGKIKLKSGQRAVFENLPAGVEYTVAEENASAGYTSTVREYSGTIMPGDKVELPFVNVHDEAAEGKLGTLAVSKEVKGAGADKGAEFTFIVTFEGEGAPESPQTITLKHGQTWHSVEIPHGTVYTVTEVDAVGYAAAFTEEKGVIAGEHEALVSFVNAKIPEPKKKSLTVRKVWDGEDANRPRSVGVQLYKDGKPYGKIVKLSGANKWKYKWKELDGDSDWMADEPNVPKDYEKTVRGDSDSGFVITNTFTKEPKDKKPKVKEPKDKKPKKPKDKKPSDDPNSKTGDDSGTMLWLSIMCFSFAGLLITLRIILKRRDDE
jgi:hypothetical protein